MLMSPIRLLAIASLALVLTPAPQASAESVLGSKEFSMGIADSFKYHWLEPVANRLGDMEALSLGNRSTPATEIPACAAAYKRVVDNRRLEIRVGLGYMDVSDGNDFWSIGINWGKSPSQDYFAREAFRRMLKKSCAGDLEACEFDVDRNDPDTFYKVVRGPSGEKIQVIVRMKSGSVTPFYLDNVGRLADYQKAQSEQAAENFFGGFKTADALIYMGHSRNGGGADFNPPLLKKDGHPNYAGYYMPKKPGLNRILKQIAAPGPNPMLFAHLSCLSEEHFGASLRKATAAAKSNMGLLLTDSPELTNYDDILRSGFATIDSLMRFQCQTGFRKALAAAAVKRPRIVMRQFLGTPARDASAPVSSKPRLAD